MEISIIIPTKERGEIFFKTFYSAYEATKNIKAEIIVINDSKFQDVILPEEFKRALVYNNPRSGVASARNYGASLAKSKNLLFLDDDIIVSENNITLCIYFLNNKSNSCVNLNWEYPDYLLERISPTQFGRYLIQNGFTSLRGWNKGEIWKDDEMFENSGVASYFLPIHKSNFDAVGGYNESFPHAGFEDYDFAVRLKKKGVTSFILPTEYVYHNEADRTELKSWLKRKKRNGETRRVAFENGYNSVVINHNSFKKIIFKTTIKFRPFILWSILFIPNLKFLDVFYFKFINLLLGASIFEGYSSKRIKK